MRIHVLPFVLALLVPTVLASPAALDSYIVSAPGAGGGAYHGETFVTDVAGTLTLVNADLRAHDVVSVAYGPDDNAWCPRYPAGQCPLFASPLLGLAEQGAVEGTEQLTPLTTYSFYCSIHPWMTGTLTAF